MVPSFMFIIFCLLFLCFLKFEFFFKHSINVIEAGASYATWNSSSVTFFANKHDHTINKEWWQEATLFGLQKETNRFKENT